MPPTEPAVPSTRTARERVRAELTAEIKQRALRQLGEVGAPALSLRAIAREMGVSSSALFRYFPSRDALLTALIVDGYGRLADAAEHAHEAAAAVGATVLERWVATCHGVRDWALAHPHEYALVYGSPVPGYTAPEDTAAPAWRVPRLLAGLLVEIAGDRPVGAWPDLPPDVAAAVTTSTPTIPEDLPRDLVVRGLMVWTYLFGAVSFELFGHRHGVVDDGGRRAVFDHEVRRLAQALGLG